MSYSRQYIYNLRSELYWCQDKLKEIKEGSEDHKELLTRIELIKRRLGSDLVPRSLRAQKFQQRIEEENKQSDSQLEAIERLLPTNTIACPYCGGSGDEVWFRTHSHANPFGTEEKVG